jgi:ribose 5-phosphate isomerase B
MKLYIASDHAGFALKEKLKIFLGKLGYQLKDFGAFAYNSKDDYPDFVKPLAESLSKGAANAKGIIIGGSGEGEAMAANRYKGVRAAVYYGGSLDIVRLSRRHNNSNILSLGARFITHKEAQKAVRVWLETEFDGGRHTRRIKKIDE